jgi:hypothetical protein
MVREIKLQIYRKIQTNSDYKSFEFRVFGLELKPEPETLNPKPETLNPKPETLNPKPETLNPKLYYFFCRNKIFALILTIRLNYIIKPAG